MRTACLLGRHYTQVGALDLVAEGPCALAISRGGANKQYSYTEPNEDACGFVWSAHGALVAVADGHHGAGGAERAIQHLIQVAPGWLEALCPEVGALEAALRNALYDIGREIFDEAANKGLPPAGTTLSLALIRPGDDLLAHASVGDSHAFVTRDGAARDLGWSARNAASPDYLGHEREPHDPAKFVVEVEPLADACAVALITDGFSEKGIGHVEPGSELQNIQRDTLSREEADLRAPDTARAIVDSAIAVQKRNRAGDNVACAVWSP